MKRNKSLHLVLLDGGWWYQWWFILPKRHHRELWTALITRKQLKKTQLIGIWFLAVQFPCKTNGGAAWYWWTLSRLITRDFFGSSTVDKTNVDGMEHLETEKKGLEFWKKDLDLELKKSLHEPRSQKGATSESKPMNMYLKTRVARTGTWRNIAKLPRKRTHRFRKRRLQEKLMELCVLWQSYGQEKWKSKQKENTNKCKIG